jgi:hypothetical protein
MDETVTFQSNISQKFHVHCICLVNCYHRNACSVLCVGVGTRLANRYLVMGDFTVEQYLHNRWQVMDVCVDFVIPVSLGEMWTIYPA